MLEAMPIYEYRCECGALFESLERVGTVRDMGSRALSHLEDMGAIQLRRGRVVLLNRAALEEIVRTGKTTTSPVENPAGAAENATGS